jgi:hypothetical protein
MFAIQVPDRIHYLSSGQMYFNNFNCRAHKKIGKVIKRNSPCQINPILEKYQTSPYLIPERKEPVHSKMGLINPNDLFKNCYSDPYIGPMPPSPKLIKLFLKLFWILGSKHT